MRYCINEFMGGVFGLGNRHQLYPSLYAAIADRFLGSSVAPIPTAFPELGELSQCGDWTPWWVYYTTKNDRGAILLAKFHDPLDAFAFAEEKQRREGASPVRMFDVRLAWELTDEAARKAKRSRFIFVETLPASWLREQRKAAERAAKLRRGA